MGRGRRRIAERQLLSKIAEKQALVDYEVVQTYAKVHDSIVSLNLCLDKLSQSLRSRLQPPVEFTASAR